MWIIVEMVMEKEEVKVYAGVCNIAAVLNYMILDRGMIESGESCAMERRHHSLHSYSTQALLEFFT